MKEENKFVNSLLNKMLEDKNAVLPAFLGNLSGTVVADSLGNVYVTLGNGEVRIVYNGRVPNVARLPVLIGKEGGDRTHVIASRDVYRTPRYPDIAPHASLHTFPGPDTIPVRGEQIVPGLVAPVSGLVVKVYSFPYELSDGWHTFITQNFDLTSYIPASGAIFVTLQADNAGELSVVSGSTVASRDALEYSDIPNANSDHESIAAIKLYAGQTSVSSVLGDIVDLRWWKKPYIHWNNLLGIPSIFPPDTSYTDGLYTGKTVALVDPTVNDDIGDGILKLHYWLNETSGDLFVCRDNALGAAIWEPVGGGGGGSGDISWVVSGALSVSDPCDVPELITKSIDADKIYVYVKTLGSAGNTTIDIILNGGSSILSAPISIAYNDSDHWASAALAVTSFSEGDILSPKITGVATGASDVRIYIRVTGTSSGGGAVDIPPSLYVYMNRNFR